MKNESLFVKIIFRIVGACVIYLSVSMTVYRFRHPSQTETELMLNAWEALRWK